MLRTVKRGKNFYVDMGSGSRRIRRSLGTQNPKIADRLTNRLEYAIADGPKSKVWAEVEPSLPAKTYRKFSSECGVSRELSVTWDELVSIFWTEKSRGWAKSTAKGYDRVLRLFGEFLTVEGVFRLKNINRELISKFQAKAETDSESRGQYRNGAGVHADMGLLCHVFKFAVDEGYVSVNPVRRQKSTAVRQVTQPFTGEDLTRLREKARGEDWLMFLLLRYTGLRGSDAVALRWSSINWKTQEIAVKSQKTGKESIIPISAPLLLALEIERPTDGHKFILSVSGRPELYRRCLTLGKKAGILNARPHRYRDTLAVDMLLKGATLHEVASILGNTAAVVEKHYAPFVPAMRSKVKAILDNEKGLEAK